jgi:hypothetical protein
MLQKLPYFARLEYGDIQDYPGLRSTRPLELLGEKLHDSSRIRVVGFGDGDLGFHDGGDAVDAGAEPLPLAPPV